MSSGNNSKDINNKIIKPIGFRTIKTAIAVFICLLISLIRNSDPKYSLFAAVICMKGSPKNGITSGFERLTGTIIGGIYGLIAILIARKFNMNVNGISYYILISVLVIPLIHTIVTIKVPESVVIGTIVYFIVTVSMALTPNIEPLMFVVYRVFETFIGIVVSVIVNITINPYDI